jgi:hypothetical protein
VGSGTGYPLGPRAASVRAVGLPLLEQPPYAPELNPAERVFEHLRAGIEGRVYPSIAEKLYTVETMLEELDADPARVKRLIGWQWIQTALADASTDYAACPYRIGISYWIDADAGFLEFEAVADEMTAHMSDTVGWSDIWKHFPDPLARVMQSAVAGLIPL